MGCGRPDRRGHNRGRPGGRRSRRPSGASRHARASAGAPGGPGPPASTRMTLHQVTPLHVASGGTGERSRHKGSLGRPSALGLHMRHLIGGVPFPPPTESTGVPCPAPVPRQTPHGGQVIDLSALIRRQSERDDRPHAPPASATSVSLRRPPGPRPVASGRTAGALPPTALPRLRACPMSFADRRAGRTRFWRGTGKRSVGRTCAPMTGKNIWRL